MIGTTFDSLTTSLATELITDAENEINKYISKRYDVSVFSTSTAVPPLLKSLCNQLAVGYMYKNMSRGGSDADERGQKYIDQVIKNLELIRDYKADLINTAGSVIADMSNTAYRVLGGTENYTPTFNEDDELNWVIDADKLDDIETERD